MDRSPHQSRFVTLDGIRLHYLDWGGSGPALLFLAGLGCNAHIFDQFAPRFTGKFHVLALTRRGHGQSDYPETGYDINTLTEDIRKFLDSLHIEQVILAGHSLASIELSHFAALHPQRVLKLVFLDAAYDRNSPSYQNMLEKNPLQKIQPPGLDQDYSTITDYLAAMRRAYPGLAAVWCDLMEEHAQHEVWKTPAGKIAEKMTDAIGAAIHNTFTQYAPEDAKIQAPVLSIYTTSNGRYYISDDWMTEEQIAQVKEFFDTVQLAWVKENMEQFQRSVPHAKIVDIPHGHHYCFIKEEERVFNEMRAFLLEG